MSDIDSGDILRLGAGLIYGGIYDVVNVWHILTASAGGQTWGTAVTQIQSWLDECYASLKTPLHEDIGTGAVSVSNVTQSTTLGTILWSPTWAGAGTGEPTASGVCCFAWGRTYKPRVQLRKYFGVFGEAQVVEGSWNAAVQSGCEGAMTYAIAARSKGPFTNFQAVAYNRTLLSHELGFSVASAAEPAYQRRRKRGRGS